MLPRAGPWFLLAFTLFGVAWASAPAGAAASDLSRIHFDGNRSFSSSTLQSLMRSRVKQLASPAQIARDVAAIAEYYRQHGFLDAALNWRLDSTGPRRVLRISVQEGARTRVRAVRAAGMRNLSAAEIVDVANVPRNQFLNVPGLRVRMQNVVDFCRDKGYFYVRCSLVVTRIGNPEAIHDSGVSARPSATDAEVTFQVTEGPVCYFHDVLVRGLVKYRRSLVFHYVNVRTGERFSQTRLLNAQRRLYASRLFDRIYLAPMSVDTSDTASVAIMTRDADSLDLRVDLSELAPRSVGFGAGIQLLPWRGLLGAEWEHLNVFQRGHNLRLAAEYSPVLGRSILRDYRLKVDALYRIPYLTRYEVNFTTQPFAYFENQLGRYQLEYGAESGLNHDFTTNLSLGVLNRLRRIWFSDTSSSSQTGIVPAITNSLSLNQLYDTRNDVFDPRRGLYFSSSAELAGGFLGGNNSFYRFKADFRFFQRVLLSHLIALRVTGGAAIPFNGSQAVPYYEEFSIGGANSLRGYNEKSIGPLLVTADSSRYGDILGSANLELRSPIIPIPTGIIKGLGGVLFTDGAVLFGAQGKYDVKRGYLGLAAGAGLRVNTPVGPIRLDYGKRLLDAPDGDWGKVYLGILNMF